MHVCMCMQELLRGSGSMLPQEILMQSEIASEAILRQEQSTWPTENCIQFLSDVSYACIC